MLTDRLPHGFRPSSAGSGLLIPSDLPRPREVWTKDEGRLSDRCMELYETRHLKVLVQCANPECPDPGIQRVRGAGTEYILRCGCRDRVFQRVF